MTDKGRGLRLWLWQFWGAVSWGEGWLGWNRYQPSLLGGGVGEMPGQQHYCEGH